MKEKVKAKEEVDYVDHLEELRWKIISVLIWFVVGFGICFLFIEDIVLLLQQPIENFDLNLYYFKPYEKFITYIKVAFYLGVFMTVPFGIFQLARFVYPALRKGEKKYLFIFSLVMPILFLGGAFFSYRLIAPLAFKFFLNFARGDNVLPFWSFGEYYNMLLMLMLFLGVLFQTPIGLLTMIKTGLVRVRTLATYRMHIIIFIAVLSAFMSPPDIISQILIGIPFYLLFEITLIIGRFLEPKSRL